MLGSVKFMARSRSDALQLTEEFACFFAELSQSDARFAAVSLAELDRNESVLPNVCALQEDGEGGTPMLFKKMLFDTGCVQPYERIGLDYFRVH